MICLDKAWTVLGQRLDSAWTALGQRLQGLDSAWTAPGLRLDSDYKAWTVLGQRLDCAWTAITHCWGGVWALHFDRLHNPGRDSVTCFYHLWLFLSVDGLLARKHEQEKKHSFE